MDISRWMDKKAVIYIYIYIMEYYSAIKKTTLESVLMRWMKLQPIRQSEVSQKEKHQYRISSVQFTRSVKELDIQLFAASRIAARQASLSTTNSWSSLKLTSIESVVTYNHLILCHPLLLLPPIPPSISLFQ